MRKKLPILIAVLLLIAGSMVLVYPAVSTFINQRHGSYAISQFQQEMGQTDGEILNEQRRLAEAYNSGLQSGNVGENYEKILNTANGMMGYISIPKINIELPIYHGVSEEVLSKGVGHMPESAFPIGGEGNHSVLTGHTGLPSAKLFTDLVELKEGDLFFIHILAEELTYQVDRIKVVLPSEAQDLAAEQGKDYCTLITCTPYGVNSHRLLVRGVRVELLQEESQKPEQTEYASLQTMMVLVSAIIALAIAAVVAVLLILRRNSKH